MIPPEDLSRLDPPDGVPSPTPGTVQAVLAAARRRTRRRKLLVVSPAVAAITAIAFGAIALGGPASSNSHLKVATTPSGPVATSPTPSVSASCVTPVEAQSPELTVKVRPVVAAGAGVLALAACGGKPSAVPPIPRSTTTATSAGATPTITVSRPPSPAASSSTVTTPSSSTPVRCRTGDLTVSQGTAPEGGSMQGGIKIVLTNTSEAPCTLDGYPGIGLYGPDGSQANLPVAQGGSYVAEDPGPHLLTISPGKAAYAIFGFTSAPTNGHPASECSQVSKIAVTPPSETAALALLIEQQRTCEPLKIDALAND